MSIIKCHLLNQELPALEAPPFPGIWGKKIYENISSKAWMMWIDEQTRMINEHRIDLSDISDREWIFEVMITFLFGQDGTSC